MIYFYDRVFSELQNTKILPGSDGACSSSNTGKENSKSNRGKNSVIENKSDIQNEQIKKSPDKKAKKSSEEEKESVQISEEASSGDKEKNSVPEIPLVNGKCDDNETESKSDEKTIEKDAASDPKDSNEMCVDKESSEKPNDSCNSNDDVVLCTDTDCVMDVSEEIPSTSTADPESAVSQSQSYKTGKCCRMPMNCISGVLHFPVHYFSRFLKVNILLWR